MTLTERAYAVVEDHFGDHEDAIILELRDRWPVEYARAVVAQHEDDPDGYDADGPPNLSFICDCISASDEARFLADLQEIVDGLYD
jgi:hypothetical protein